MKKMNKKGFTLAELLIVVAIIAVLVAIAIPIFTSQLEKSREATDASNIRAAYAELMADALLNDKETLQTSVKLTQGRDDWQKEDIDIAGGYSGKDVTVVYTSGKDKPIADGKCYISYTPANATGTATITFTFQDS